MGSYYDGDILAAFKEVETSVYKLYFAFKKAGYLEESTKILINLFMKVVTSEIFRKKKEGDQNEDQH